METKEQEAKEAWREDAEGSMHDGAYLKAISDFKTALIEALKKEVKPIEHSFFENGWNQAVDQAISLVKTVTPKKK